MKGTLPTVDKRLPALRGNMMFSRTEEFRWGLLGSEANSRGVLGAARMGHSSGNSYVMVGHEIDCEVGHSIDLNSLWIS